MASHEIANDGREILDRFSFFRDAPPALQREILEVAELARLAPGTYFYREGDLCSHVGLVGNGNIRVFKSGLDAQEITLYHVGPGQPCLVNVLAAFLDRPAVASGIAEAPTVAMLIPAAPFRHWVGTADGLQRFVFESLSMRLIDVMVLVEALAFQRVDQRLARWLLEQFDHGERTAGVLARTHEEIAHELGTAREVVSRLVKDFERMGAVHAGRGRVELVDRKILDALARGR